MVCVSNGTADMLGEASMPTHAAKHSANGIIPNCLAKPLMVRTNISAAPTSHIDTQPAAIIRGIISYKLLKVKPYSWERAAQSRD